MGCAVKPGCGAAGRAHGPAETAPLTREPASAYAWLGFGLMTANEAPCASARMASRPTVGTSMAGAQTLPPMAVVLATVASTSCTLMYGSQYEGTLPGVSGRRAIIPPADAVPRLNTVYGMPGMS